MQPQGKSINGRRQKSADVTDKQTHLYKHTHTHTHILNIEKTSM